MNKSNHRSPFAIVRRLIVLVKPMLPIMLAASSWAWQGISAPPSLPSSAVLASCVRWALPVRSKP